jgi:predicted PolB exonuclease-like 3'-5' exonuclease
VVIGALWFASDYAVRRIGVVGEGKDERGLLQDFVKLVDERRPCLVTYNGRGFDLPVIATRCLRHGIPFRYYYGSRDVRYRFTPEGHLDLMDYVADFGAAKPSKLDVIAKLCGMPGKVGVDGKDVGPLVHAGKLESVRDYCLCDVAQTAAVFLRIQLLRGELSISAYKSAMGALIETVKTDQRVAAVASALNEPRLLLEEPPSDVSAATE